MRDAAQHPLLHEGMISTFIFTVGLGLPGLVAALILSAEKPLSEPTRSRIGRKDPHPRSRMSCLMHMHRRLPPSQRLAL